MMNHTGMRTLCDLLAYLVGVYAANTLRAYKANMLEFITYCDKAAKCALPADPNTVSEFLMQTMGTGIKSSTIRQKVCSISAIHRLSCLSDPTKHS
jgi:site-specific recombinase XerD